LVGGCTHTKPDTVLLAKRSYLHAVDMLPPTLQ